MGTSQAGEWYAFGTQLHVGKLKIFYVLSAVHTFGCQRSWCARVILHFETWWYVAFQYNYAGRYNLPKFLRLVHEAGMYVSLRIGPYVCAEWNSGYAVIFSHLQNSSTLVIYNWEKKHHVAVSMIKSSNYSSIYGCDACMQLLKNLAFVLDMSTEGFPLGYVLCQALSSALTMSPSRYLQILALDCYCAMDAIVK